MAGLPRPDLGLTGLDGTNVTLVSLLAVAVAGDRFLQQAGQDSTPPDPAAFASLSTDAFEAQQDA